MSDDVKPELWVHQVAAAKKIQQRQIQALWWVMRCGKTAAAIEGTKGGDRLIVCPSSVKQVWFDDCRKWGAGTTWIFDRKGKPSERPNNVIVNYETIWRTDLLEKNWDSIIFDESHRLANFRTKLFEYILCHMREVCSANVLLLSGTPCPEGWHQLIAQSIVATGQFCGYTDPWAALRAGWVYDDSKYKWIIQPGWAKKCEAALHEMGETMTQAQAGITTKKLYRIIPVHARSHEEDLFKEWMEDEPTDAQYGLACQSAASGRNKKGITVSSAKLDAIVNYVQELGAPYVILTRFTSSLKYLQQKLGSSTGYICGEDEGIQERTKIIERFNSGKLQGIAASVRTVKVGLNLSHSSCLIFAENDFSGEARIQAEERCTVRGKEAVEIIDFVLESDTPGLGEVDLAIRSTVVAKKDFQANALKTRGIKQCKS